MRATTGVGTTYRGSNAELISFCSSAEFKEDKQFISDMNGQVYENRTGSADNTQDNNTPQRYLRLYPSSEGNIIAQFERDANRDDLPSEGAWKFIAEVQNTQKQNTSFIASPGMTLQILSGGNQEKLWALTAANPGYLPTDDLGGQEVIIPYAYTGLQLNASSHGFQTSSNYIKGPSVPSAPAPLAPEPGRVGGFKRFCACDCNACGVYCCTTLFGGRSTNSRTYCSNNGSHRINNATSHWINGHYSSVRCSR